MFQLTESTKTHTLNSFIEMLVDKKKVKVLNGSFAFAFLYKNFAYKVFSKDDAYSDFILCCE